MTDLLETSHRWLERQYDALLGESHRKSVMRWHRVSRSDFRSASGGNPDDVGVLQDEALGLLLLVLPLDGSSATFEDRINSDVSLALRLRSELLPKYTGSSIPDESYDQVGTWRVCLHWLMPMLAKDKWIRSIMDLRGKSGAFDEVPVDAVYFESAQGLEAALDDHGLPRLLLHTRHVFSMPPEGVVRWSDADQNVRESMRDISKKFSDRQRDIATSIEKIIHDYGSTGNSGARYAKSPDQLNTLEVLNFRSIRALKLEGAPGRSEAQRTRAWIIHGPNGTGKTSLAEALALRSFGTSFRFWRFLGDGDERTGKNADGYIKRYLMQYGNKRLAQEPACRINGKEGDLQSDAFAQDWAESDKRLRDSEGTVSSQEQTQLFVNLTSSELYSRVAGSFSALARAVQNHVDQGYKEANERREQNNARFGLSARAKLEKTINARIATSRVTEELPKLASSAKVFLELFVRLGGPGVASVQKLLQQWGSAMPDDSYGHGLAKIADLGTDYQSQLSSAVLQRLREHASTVKETRNVVARFEKWRFDLGEALPDMVQQIRIWGEWIAGRIAPAGAPEVPGDSEQRVVLDARLRELLDVRKKIEDDGKPARARLDHLVNALQFLESHWEKEHPNACPTCSSDVAAQGGIRTVIEGLRATLEGDLEALRNQYGATTAEIKQVEAKLKAIGQEQCPLPEPLRKQIETELGKLLGADISLEAMLMSPDSRHDVLRLFEYALSPPGAPPEMKVTEEGARQIAWAIAEEWRKADDIAKEPDAWEDVKKEVVASLKSVVDQHLPATIGRVWIEIYTALTAAPWLLPQERPRFASDLRGSTPQVHLRIGENRLVRYFLNNAEQHILGIAWVLTRHITHGRFSHAWLLLDDPAQEMDQPTFRDLARFLATLQRLYEKSGQPFTLVLLLHQEERALDAARELDSGLYLLGWAPEQNEPVRRMVLYGPGYHAPSPQLWFKSTDTVSK